MVPFKITSHVKNYSLDQIWGKSFVSAECLSWFEYGSFWFKSEVTYNDKLKGNIVNTSTDCKISYLD